MAIELVDKKAVNFTEAELKGFLAPRRIVVADSGTSAGRSIRKFLMQFGAKSDSVLVCETYAQAKIEVAAKPTHLLMFDIGFGFDLVPLQESLFPSRAEISTIILGNDPAADCIGSITESNVDAMLIKPFNFQSFKDALYQALANKVKPSQYWVLLEKGKELLKSDKFDDAEKVFETAKKLDSKPTLAYYYLAQVLEKKSNPAGAVKILNDGLQFDEKNYQCLSSLFSIHLKSNHAEAYEIAKRIHKNYPVSAARIPDLVKLSVYVRKFGDIADYYEIFKNLERQDATLNRVIIAGMLVCARYFFSKKDDKMGKEVLSNAAKVAMKTELLQLDVLRYYEQTGQFQDGIDFFGKLPEAIQKQQAAEMIYVELIHQAGDMAGTVKWGTQLLQKGASTPRLYKMVIEGSTKTERSEKAILDLTAEAKSKFPASF